MPRKKTADKQHRADLLAKVPDSAKRVLVVTETGKRKYKALLDLADADRIQTNKSGIPIVMKNEPGRKSSVAVGPANAVVAEILRRKQVAMDADGILQVARATPESADVLQAVIVGLGEEAASLGFERSEAARNGKDSSSYSAKRVQALKAVGETWLKRMDQLVTRSVDMDSPGFKVLFKFVIDTFREAMAAGAIRPEQIDTVFAKLGEMINDDWYSEAKSRMKNSV